MRNSRGRRRAELLRALGAAVRSRRNELRLTLRALAQRAGVSERYLAQLETGDGNISVARLQDVAEALETNASELLALRAALPSAKAPAPPSPVVALVGLRGAGKSTLGPAVAQRLGVGFYELDALVARAAGMPLAVIFEMHGEAWFRRIEYDVLRAFLDAHDSGVLATGGSIVTAPEAFEMLRERTFTVWLRANAQDHWQRVVRQGDLRPMRNRANAMAEMKALLRSRRPLYALADHKVDTSKVRPDEAADRIVAAVARRSNPSKRRGTEEV